MINRMLLITLFLTVWGVPHLSHAIPTVTAGSATVTVSDTFTIPISITDAVDLTSFQFDLSFDPSILQVTATGLTESAFFTQGDITVFVPGAVDNTTGQILGVSDALIFQSPVNGSEVLVNVEFTAIAAGISPLTLSSVFLNLLDSGFTVTNGSVCVNPASGGTCESPPGQVPEPSTFALLGLGLGVLAWRRTLSFPRALGGRGGGEGGHGLHPRRIAFSPSPRLLLFLLIVLPGCGGDTAGDGPNTTGGVGAALPAERAAASEGDRPPSGPGPVPLPDADRGRPPSATEPSDGVRHLSGMVPDPLEVQAYLTAAQQHPDATVRLRALEVWAQHGGGSVDTVTQALVDEDEMVRARAQELWEEAIRREAREGRD